MKTRTERTPSRQQHQDLVAYNEAYAEGFSDALEQNERNEGGGYPSHTRGFAAYETGYKDGLAQRREQARKRDHARHSFAY